MDKLIKWWNSIYANHQPIIADPVGPEFWVHSREWFNNLFKEFDMKIYRLSEKELAMFKALGVEELEKTLYSSAIRLYRDTAIECMVENKTGPAVESLRRCLVAIGSGEVQRGTEEWDNLIQL